MFSIITFYLKIKYLHIYDKQISFEWIGKSIYSQHYYLN